jgi:hypothetical protein
VKRVFAALVLATVVASAVYASAASLGLTSDDLGAGDDAVGRCDTSFTVTYIVNTANKVTDVTVGGIARPACSLGELSVALTNSANINIGEGGPVTIPAGGTDASVTVNILALPDAISVKATHIIIVGP